MKTIFERSMTIDTTWGTRFQLPRVRIVRVGCAALLAILCIACGREQEASQGQAAVVDAPAEESVAKEVPTRTITIPTEAENPAWLAERAERQKKSSASWKVFHDFRFTDRLPESGIDWSHSATPDAAKDYKPVHYDHGTGVAIADVDGDGLLDIYFVAQVGKNGLWRNLGGGKFEDITWNSSLPMFDRVSVAASFADVDNDGDADLYVTSVRDGNVLYENDGRGRFSDITEKSGLGYKGHSSAAVFFDYDRDGLLDLFLVNIGVYTTEVRKKYWIGVKDAFYGHLLPERTERSQLYRNLGGNRFENVTKKVGLDDTRWSGDACPIDVNRDGWIDLYVLNMQGLDGYWENSGGTKFVDKTQEVFPRSSWGAMGIQAFDFENDGDVDIFITDMHSDMWETVAPTQIAEKRVSLQPPPADILVDGGMGIFGNTFFVNQADGTFREASQEVGAENFWPWGLSVGDLNADGYGDAFVASSMNYPYRYGVNSVLLNDRGQKFVDAEFVLGVEPRRDGKTTKEWFEIDCNGEDRYHKDCPKDGEKARVIVKAALGTRSSVVFDLDDDGDLDIVTNEFGSEPQILVSNLSERKDVSYLKVRLIGTESNRDGLGARVTVSAGEQSYLQLHHGQSGYLSQSSQPLYFGLADADDVDEIRILWPSGKEQVLAGPIEVNQAMEITEPK